MRFLIDAQLPPALVKLLEDAGHQAEHVADVGMEDAGDTDIWNYALQNGAVIVTKDEDFPYRHSQAPANSPAILWLRIGNCTRKALLEWFEPLLPGIETLLREGTLLIEVR